VSWSRGFTGSARSCGEAFRAAIEEIKAPLPDFEKDDVVVVADAAGQLLEAVPEGATVSLSVSGHGWRSTPIAIGDSTGAGAMTVSVNYSLPLATDLDVAQPAAPEASS
jgi:hypothetical protein